MAALTLASCAPSAKQLKEAIEKDPSIVFSAIEKDPVKFIEVVNKAAQDAQQGQAARAQDEEKKARDAEFKTPLTPEVEAGRVIFGKADAPITIVEYSDFQCPYCSRGYQTVQEVRKEYGDKVRVVFKHLPLDFHPLAMPAAKYFEAIAKQQTQESIPILQQSCKSIRNLHSSCSYKSRTIRRGSKAITSHQNCKASTTHQRSQATPIHRVDKPTANPSSQRRHQMAPHPKTEPKMQQENLPHCNPKPQARLRQPVSCP